MCSKREIEGACEDDRSCCVGTILAKVGGGGRIGTSDSCAITETRCAEALSWRDDAALGLRGSLLSIIAKLSIFWTGSVLIWLPMSHNVYGGL